jgi:CheY-like chemotaxis protein
VVTDYNFQKLNALVVDDHFPMHQIMRGILKEFGLNQIATVTSGAAAIAELETFQPDIIFTDYMMEEMNGLELIQEIRAGNTGSDRFIPIVVVSAYTGIRDILAARDIGATEFLAKPISGQQVFNRLRSIMENPREYVEADSFFGPDRRRRELGPGEDNRRQDEYEYKKLKRKPLQRN